MQLKLQNFGDSHHNLEIIQHVVLGWTLGSGGGVRIHLRRRSDSGFIAKAC